MKFAGALIVGAMGFGMASAALAKEISEPPLLPYLVIEGRESAPSSVSDVMTETGVRTLSYVAITDGIAGEARTMSEAGLDAQSAPLFQAASISKPVAAIGVLRLAEQEGLDIDADVNRYLTSWKVDYAGYEDAPKVTIRRLLAHRAGLTVHGFPGYEPQEPELSSVDVLEGRGNTEAVTLFQAPGTGFSYSGGGYTVLQLLVEDVTGKTFAAYMEREVLAPLGMLSSHFRDHPEATYAAAVDGSGKPYEVPYHVYPEKAAAALWTSAPDLARFLIAVDAMLDGKRTDILSADMAAQLLAVPQGEGPEPYALGFGVDRADSYEVFQHSGSNFGYKTLMFFDRRSKNGFVSLTDADRGSALNSMLVRGFSRARGIDFMTQRTLVPSEQSASDWARIEGVWVFPDGPLSGRRFRFEARPPADMLATEIATSEKSQLLAIGPMEFIDTETTSTLVFKETDAGVLEAVFANRFRMVRSED